MRTDLIVHRKDLLQLCCARGIYLILWESCFAFSFNYMNFPDMIIKVSFQSVIWEDLILSLLCGNYVKHHSDRDEATSGG